VVETEPDEPVEPVKIVVTGTIVEVSFEEAGGREYLTLLLAVETLEPAHWGTKEQLGFQRRVQAGDEKLEVGAKLRICSQGASDLVVYTILELVPL
jgi:hypothetical protein